MDNYYDKQQLASVERVKLAADIILPEVSTEPLTLKYLQSGREYKTPFTEYTDMEGKFYLTIMTPLLNKEQINNRNQVAPSVRGHRGNLGTNNYSSSNYITLTIPKYILLNFINKVPKGTEFIVASIGNSIDIDDLRIVGIYSIITNGGK